MKQTVTANIGGYAFIVEVGAYESLCKYIDSIAVNYAGDGSGKEILSDIETRIGEILTEIKGGSEVVTEEMVEIVKKRVGDPEVLKEDREPSAENPDTGGVKVRRRLFRDVENQTIGGVCSGLAELFKIDVVWVRVVFFALFIGGPFVWDGNLSVFIFLLYVLLWVCIPAARTVQQKCQMRGEPVSLDQYRGYVPAQAPKKGRNLSIIGRLIAAFAGFIFLIIGGGCIVGSAALPFCTHFGQKNYVYEYVREELADDVSAVRKGGVIKGTFIIGDSGIVVKDSLRICPSDVDSLEMSSSHIAVGRHSVSGHEVVETLLLNRTFWWLVFAVVLVLGLLCCYAGIKLLFNVRGPEWRPGIILFVIWVISVLSLGVFCVWKVLSLL